MRYDVARITLFALWNMKIKADAAVFLHDLFDRGFLIRFY